MTAAEFRPFDIASAFVYATVSLNGKRREQKRAGSRGAGGTGGRENCISLAWRDAAEHARRKTGLPHPGDERSSLSGRRDYVVVETTLLVCGTEREREKTRSFPRVFTRMCVLESMNIYFHRVKILLCFKIYQRFDLSCI